MQETFWYLFGRVSILIDHFHLLTSQKGIENLHELFALRRQEFFQLAESDRNGKCPAEFL
jgi:hypothetical protein